MYLISRALGAALVLAASALSASAVTLQAIVTFEETVTVNTATDGFVAVASNSGGGVDAASQSILFGEARATAGSLHSYTIGAGPKGISTHPRFQAVARMVIDDVIFSTQPGDTTPFAVTLNLDLEGVFTTVIPPGGSSVLALGAAYIRGTVRTGNLVDLGGDIIEAAKSNVLNFETRHNGSVLGAGPVSGILSHTFLALPNAARRIEITLMTESNGYLLNWVTYGSSADASNSLRFDPSKVFDLPDGVTASSASCGLVNNQLP